MFLSKEQQRQFNTFVRDSINQLLGSDFMRTHDVQDIDSQVMEMIRSNVLEKILENFTFFSFSLQHTL